MAGRSIPDRLLPATVTIQHASVTTDRYGNQATDWTRATTEQRPAWLQQQAASEKTADRDQQVGLFRLILPAGVDISGSDRVVYQGRTFEVVGPPETVLTPRGAHHIEALLRWLEG